MSRDRKCQGCPAKGHSASIAPMPKNKKEKPSVSPSDLAERVMPLAAMRAKALLRSSFGDVEEAKDVLERLAQILRELDETASDGPADEAARGGTAVKRRRKATT
jgi:hypothetical protein